MIPLAEAGLWTMPVLFALVLADGVPVLGTVAPGYLALIAAGVAVKVGDLPLLAVLAVGIAGAVLGDLVAYEMGRRWGPRLLARLPARVQAGASALNAPLDGHTGKTLVIAKFFGLTRQLAPPLAGALGVPVNRFALWTVAGVALWAVRAVAIGWIFGAAWENADAVLGWLALVVALPALAGYVWWRRRARSASGAPSAVETPA